MADSDDSEDIISYGEPTPDDVIEQVMAVEKDSLQALIERNADSGWPDLEPVEKAFAYNYIIHYDHRKAANDVGLNPGSGLNIRRKPLVSAFISFLQDKEITSSLVTKDFVDTQHLRLFEIATGQVAVPHITARGLQFTAPKFYPDLAIRVLNEMARLNDLLPDQKVSVKMSSDPESISDEELLAIINSRKTGGSD